MTKYNADAAAIELDDTSIRLSLYDLEYAPDFTLYPSTADKSKVTFKSSAPTVASIDLNTGLVTPHKKGTTTITATTSTGKKDTMKITVFDPYEPTKVTFAQGTAMNLYLNEPVSLTPVLEPSTAKCPAYTWKSSSTKIVTVSETGLLTPIKKGSATITATTHNGKKATIKVKVVDPYDPTALTLNYPSGVTKMWDINQPLKLSYTAQTIGGSKYPMPAEYVAWSSSSKSIAEIDEQGNVTIKKTGTVTFTLKATNGVKATAKFKIVVPKPLESIKLSHTKLRSGMMEMRVDYPFTIKATLTPSVAEPITNLVWSSDNTKLATVDQNGNVNPLEPGTCHITLTDTKSGISAFFTLVISLQPDYRAVVSVEATDLVFDNYYYGKSTRQTDYDGMVKALGMQNYNGHKWSLTKLHTTSATKTLAAIDALAAKAKPHDVSMFYFMGHGGTDGTIYFYDNSSISPATLKAHLDKIAGKVVVLLGSCYSGKLIGKNPASFNSSIMRTFNVGDTVPLTYVNRSGETVVVTEEMLTYVNANGETIRPKAGELAQNKYYVLTAASGKQEGWSIYHYNYYVGRRKVTINESKSYTYFCRALARAAGWDPITKKTVGTKGERTLNEVYREVYDYVKNQDDSSDVQVYPTNSSFILFQR